MTAKDLASVVLRVIGIYFIAEGAAFAVNTVAHRIGASEWSAEVVFSGIFAIANSIAGIVMLRGADRIAAWLVRDLEVAESTADAGQIQTIAFSILACYLLVTGLAQLTGIGHAMWARPRWDETRTLEYLLDHSQASFGTAISFTLAGAILLLGRFGFARAWRVVRDRQT
jgi:hypothetical protein